MLYNSHKHPTKPCVYFPSHIIISTSLHFRYVEVHVLSSQQVSVGACDEHFVRANNAPSSAPASASVGGGGGGGGGGGVAGSSAALFLGLHPPHHGKSWAFFSDLDTTQAPAQAPAQAQAQAQAQAATSRRSRVVACGESVREYGLPFGSDDVVGVELDRRSPTGKQRGKRLTLTLTTNR